MNAAARRDDPLSPQDAQNRPGLGTTALSSAQKPRAAEASLLAITAVISIGALIFYYHQGALLLYVDAAAHINIARRVFDSRTPSLLGLGTVWLPLPHLLDIPFLVNDRMWQSGLGASVPSMIAYLAGTLGVFRLVSGGKPSGLASRPAAGLAALIYALNPNLIYMQSTAMTEPLYLALFIWAAVYFAEFARRAGGQPENAGRPLVKCGVMIALAMLVRYDGWFLAGVTGICALGVLWRSRGNARRMVRGWIAFTLLTGATAAAFLLYNYAISGNALEFANGPYSARAIQ